MNAKIYHSILDPELVPCYRIAMRKPLFAAFLAVMTLAFAACGGPISAPTGSTLIPLGKVARATATPKPTPQFVTLTLGYPQTFTTVGSCFEGLAINTQFSKSLTLTEIQAPSVAQTYAFGLYSDSGCLSPLWGPKVLKANQTIKLSRLSPTGAVWVFVNGTDTTKLLGPITITAKVIPL